METKNNALAGMAMEDDSLEIVTGGASLYEREYPRLERPGVEPPKLEGPKLELPLLEPPRLSEDIVEIHKKIVEMEKHIDD